MLNIAFLYEKLKLLIANIAEYELKNIYFQNTIPYS